MDADAADTSASGIPAPSWVPDVDGPPSQHRPFDELVGAAQDGNEDAFAAVYRLMQPPLLRYLRVLVGSEADDVASETWAQVCRDLRSFHGDGDGFRGWVVTIGRHRALDHLRAARRRPTDPWSSGSMKAIAWGERATDEQALESLSTADAVALIATLPRDQAEAVMLRAVLGLDARAAGAVLGKRPGAVRTSAYRGLRALAARLEAGGDR
jgi:RNA polymerase sigma-70 factor, ECF subfamily